jgi:hypothetical protein
MGTVRHGYYTQHPTRIILRAIIHGRSGVINIVLYTVEKAPPPPRAQGIVGGSQSASRTRIARILESEKF